jgi:predicted GIY-YIG superfamily endonuclease
MFYVYILSNRTGQLSAGVTRHISRHLEAHLLEIAPCCTHKHQIDRLLLLESFRHSTDAAAREGQLNRCTLTEKLEVIRGANPKFEDLAPTLQG